jgi:nucleotide-binding universal stress UspA family protein
MFKNVLVGVDGGPNGRDAITLASRLVGAGGKLTLAHVHSGNLHPLHAVEPGVVDQEHDASVKLLEEERHTAGLEDASLASIVARSPGAGLHTRAEEQDADLIVVGSCSRGALGRVMLGDDTRAALNGAPCAVAIAQRGYAEHPTPLAKIGVAYNGSPESESALECGRDVAAPTRASILALEVVAIPTYAYTGLMVPTAGGGLDEILADANTRMQELDGVEGRAVYGLSGEELAAFGDEVDLLVVGSRSYGPVKRLVIGSTSDYLERHARCGLLVLPRAVAAGKDDEGSESLQAPAGA